MSARHRPTVSLKLATEGRELMNPLDGDVDASCRPKRVFKRSKWWEWDEVARKHQAIRIFCNAAPGRSILTTTLSPVS